MTGGTGPLGLQGVNESAEDVDLNSMTDEHLERLGRELIKDTPTVRALEQRYIIEEMRSGFSSPPSEVPTRPARNGTFVWDENSEQFIIERKDISDVEA